MSEDFVSPDKRSVESRNVAQGLDDLRTHGGNVMHKDRQNLLGKAITLLRESANTSSSLAHHEFLPYDSGAWSDKVCRVCGKSLSEHAPSVVACSEPVAWAIYDAISDELIDVNILKPENKSGIYCEPLVLKRASFRDKTDTSPAATAMPDSGALACTIDALKIISDGEAPYGDLPAEVKETCGNAVDYLVFLAPSANNEIAAPSGDRASHAQAGGAEAGPHPAVAASSTSSASAHNEIAAPQASGSCASTGSAGQNVEADRAALGDGHDRLSATNDQQAVPGPAAAAMWARFMEHLNKADPLVFKRDEPPRQHLSFLGDIERYRAIFLEANNVAPSSAIAPTTAMPDGDYFRELDLQEAREDAETYWRAWVGACSDIATLRQRIEQLKSAPPSSVASAIALTDSQIAAFEKSWTEITMPARGGRKRIEDALKAMHAVDMDKANG